MARAVAFAAAPLAALLAGCNSDSQIQCGTTGGGTVPATNNPSYTCTNCGAAPCVDSSGTCWSCYAPSTQSCYPYNCNGVCQSTPCSSSVQCGTTGGGTVPAANNPAYTCTNCGTAPCVDSSGSCWSCYAPSTQMCYAYNCNGVCQNSPCTSTVQCGNTGGGTVPATNNPSSTCTNCGTSPCVDSKGTCWSCYAPSTQQCYAYNCNGVCQNAPCAFGANSQSMEGVPAGIQNISAAHTKPPPVEVQPVSAMPADSTPKPIPAGEPADVQGAAAEVHPAQAMMTEQTV